MIETIRRLNLFSLYDRSGIVRYLKKMAARGWLVCDIHTLLWKFRRIDPQELEFSVSYDHKGEDYDFRTSDRQQGLIEMGEEAGWNLAASTSKMQVFWTDRPDAIPMQTEPVSELNNIRPIMRKTMRIEFAVIAGLILFRLLNDGPYLRVLLTEVLADSMFIYGYISLLLLIIAAVIEWGMYLVWRRKAEHAAQTGDFVDTPHTRIVSIVMIVLLAWFIFSSLGRLLIKNPRTTLAVVIAWVITLAAIKAAIALAIRILKTKSFSASKNRLITAGAGFVAGMIVIYIFVSVSGTLALPIKDDIIPEDLPVEIQLTDIPSVPSAEYETEHVSRSTFIISRHYVKQGSEDGSNTLPWMKYSISKVKTGLFRQTIIKKALKQFSSGSSAAENASFWGADEALQATNYYGKANSYLLVYDSYILEIDFSWEPTVEQKAHIGQIMKSIAFKQ